MAPTFPNSPTPTPGTVLITGGAKRLGAAIGLALAGAGWDVVVHYRHSQAPAEELCEEIRGLGRRAWAVAADLADPEQCSSLIPRAVDLAGGLEALISSASIFPSSTVFDVTAADIQKNIQVHAVAPLQLAQALWQRPEARHIVHMLDSKVTGPDNEHVGYHLSKRMLSDLTRMLARAFAPRVAVNAIAPGAILPAIDGDPARFATLASGVPLQKTGQARDITQAALYLLSSQYVTGQTLYVDGGRHMEGNLYG
jgi:pteridine reductase